MQFRSESMDWQQRLKVAGGLTKTEWLKQQLPPLCVSFSLPPGLRTPQDDIVPVEITSWDIWQDVRQYVADADTKSKSSRHKTIDIGKAVMARKGFSSESDCQSIYDALLVEMGSVLIGIDKLIVSGWRPSTSSSMTQQCTTADISSGELDDPMVGLKNTTKLAVHPEFRVQPNILLKSIDKIFLVVETKKPSFFRSAADGEIPNLVEAYRKRGRKSLDQQRSHVLVQSIIQLVRFLVVHEIAWGIISSADLTYFVRREGDSLRISEGIRWCHVNFIAALAYTMETAAGDTTEYVWRGGEGGKRSQDFDVDDSQDTEYKDSQDTSSQHDE